MFWVSGVWIKKSDLTYGYLFKRFGFLTYWSKIVGTPLTEFRNEVLFPPSDVGKFFLKGLLICAEMIRNNRKLDINTIFDINTICLTLNIKPFKDYSTNFDHQLLYYTDLNGEKWFETFSNYSMKWICLIPEPLFKESLI